MTRKKTAELRCNEARREAEKRKLLQAVRYKWALEAIRRNRERGLQIR
jgi:hypothetical protein